MPIAMPSSNQTIHGRSRDGCKPCKAMRRKCDEAKPACVHCQKMGTPCVYQQDLAPIGEHQTTHVATPPRSPDSFFYEYKPPEHSKPGQAGTRPTNIRQPATEQSPCDAELDPSIALHIPGSDFGPPSRRISWYSPFHYCIAGRYGRCQGFAYLVLETGQVFTAGSLLQPVHDIIWQLVQREFSPFVTGRYTVQILRLANFEMTPTQRWSINISAELSSVWVRFDASGETVFSEPPEQYFVKAPPPPDRRWVPEEIEALKRLAMEGGHVFIEDYFQDRTLDSVRAKCRAIFGDEITELTELQLDSKCSKKGRHDKNAIREPALEVAALIRQKKTLAEIIGALPGLDSKEIRDEFNHIHIYGECEEQSDAAAARWPILTERDGIWRSMLARRLILHEH
ncbi:hypothetical protein FALBO_11634 [Fusarium albosuccineum]|uniref:Zn(2)-C6 fungal-type domain-containing protein n=1 Tax=Fusarium albosuccineum TaxID=1237068 RepID=A0A8H4P3W8_9HYPO|nr:hypothetical protein FALBO_11634 [Fusarium albosuccineum]